MKNKFVYIIILLFAFGSLKAKKHQEFTITVYNENNKNLGTLTLGIDEEATIFYDIELERSLPPFPPPGTMMPVFDIAVADSSEVISSDIDFRPIAVDSDTAAATYSLRMLGYLNNKYKLKWNLAPKIDSAYIQDKYTQKIININMKDTNEILIDKIGHGTLYVKVWYNMNAGSSVIEEADANEVFPNPSNGKLYLSNINEVSHLDIYSLTGEKVKEFKNMNDIDISELNNAMYVAKIYYFNDKIKTFKFVKN